MSLWIWPMWLGLASVAVIYAVEWSRRRQEHGPIPSPVRHPAVLLLRALTVLRKLWPLVALIALATLVHSLIVSSGTWPEHSYLTDQGLAAYVLQYAAWPWWMGTSLLRPVATHVLNVLGPGSELGSALLLALCGWVALRDPWTLGRRARIVSVVTAAGVIFGGIFEVVVMSAFHSGGHPPSAALVVPYTLIVLVPSAVACAIVAALIFHAVLRRPLRPANLARTVLASWTTWLVLGVLEWLLELPGLAVYPDIRVFRSGAVQGFLSTLVSWSPWTFLAAQIAVGWAVWIAAEREVSPWRALADWASLFIRSPGLLALMLLEMGLFLVPAFLAVHVLTEVMKLVDPLVWLVHPVNVVLDVYVLAVSACAYKSFAYEMKHVRDPWYARLARSFAAHHAEAR